MSVQQDIVSEHLRRSAPRAEDVVSVDGFSDVEAMSHAFWLNDLLFVVPPENITAQSEDVLWKSSALRANHTAKIHSGQGTQVYRIQINCPYKGAILNVDWRNDGLEGNTGKRGGLLDLIIQFKSIPFARVENAFLRSTLRIPKNKSMAFCLHSLSINTVPGEPNNVEAVLLVTVFNYSAYSPDWAYKDDWVAKPQYGGARFSDVNPIVIENALKPRDPYEYFLEGNDLDRQIIDGWVNDSDTSGTDSTNVEFNIAMTESEDYLWNSESHFLMPPKPVKHPALSSVFKDYMDWLQARWHKREDAAGTFNAAKISLYGSSDQNLGDSIKFSWREYKRFPMDKETRDAVQRQIREYVLGVTEPRTIRPLNQGPIAPTNSGDGDALGPDAAIGDDALARVLATEMMRINRGLEPDMALTIGYAVINAGREVGTSRVTPAWLCATMEHESHFDFDAISSGNARGLLQLRTGALAQVWPIEADFIPNPDQSNPNLLRIVDPERAFSIQPNVLAGARYLEWCYQQSESDGFVPNRWLAYYNRGPNGIAQTIDWNNINREDGSSYQRTVEGNYIDWVRAIERGDIADVYADDAFHGYDASSVPAGLEPQFLNNRPRRPNTNDVVDIQESTLADVEAYQNFVNKIEASNEGWLHYREDLTVTDVFYRDHSFIVNTNSSSQEGQDPNRAPITVPFMSGTATNLYAQLPLNGQMLPTAQYMGKRDDTFLIQMETIGLNNVKMARHMVDMLRSQSKEFPYIPDSWSVRVENNLINAFGNRHFVFNAVNYVTIRENPGLYGIEIHLESNPIDRGDSRITAVTATSLEDIRRAFVQDLMNNRLITINAAEDGNYYVTPTAGVEDRISEDSGGGLLAYLQFVSAGINSVNSLFIKDRSEFNPSDWNSGFLISDPTRGSHPEGSPVEALGLEQGPAGTSFIFRNRPANGRSYLEDASDGINGRLNIRDAWPNVGVLTYQDRNGLNFEARGRGAGNRTARGEALLQNLFYRYQDNKRTSRFSEMDPVGTQYDWNANFAGNLEPRQRSSDQQTAQTNLYDDLRRELRVMLERNPNNIPITRPYIRFNPEAAAYARSLNAYFAHILRQPNFHSLYIQETDRGRRIADPDFGRTQAFRNGNPPITRRVDDLYWSSDLEPLFFGGSVYDGETWSNPFDSEFTLENGFFGTQLLESASLITNNSAAPPVLIEGPGGVTRTQNFTPPTRRGLTPLARSTGAIESARRGYNTDSPRTFFNRITPGSGAEERFASQFETEAKALLSENFRDFEVYLWEQVARPYLINTFLYSEIRKYANYIDVSASTGDDVVYLFPQTRDAIRRQRVTAAGPCFPDLELPLHPYWNADPENDWEEIYTDPDFYMYNWGFEGNAEVPAPEVPADGVLTADKAYNVLTQVETEYAIESMYGLRPEKLHQENQALGRENPFVFNGGPGRLASLYDGTNMAIDMEYGFGGVWRPTTDGEERDTWTMDSGDGDDKLRNSSINSNDVNTNNSPDSLNSTEAEDSFGTTSSSWINHGMNGLVGYLATNHVKWADVIAQFGPNVDFPDSPPEYDPSFQNFGPDFWGFNQVSSEQMLIHLQGSDFTPYRFNVDTVGPDPDRFVRGNWGYDDVGQWSNTRTALYGKVRDALRSLGRKKYVGRRAFPTFKVYFIEEDLVENGRYVAWKQIDDLYVYNQVESIKINDSRKRAASTCVITFLNLGGALDGRNMWAAAQRPMEDDTPAQRRDVNARRRSESVSVYDLDTADEQNINEFILQEGTKLKVKVGNSNHPDRLDTLFLGVVTETKYTEEGNKVTVVAQSYGTELVAEYKGTTVKEVKKTYNNTFDLLAHMMFEPELKHFGRHTFDAINVAGENQSLAQNEIIYKNTLGRRPGRIALRAFANVFMGAAGTVVGGPLGGVIGAKGLDWLGQAREAIKRTTTQLRQSPTEGPQDDNIYAPNFTKDEVGLSLGNIFSRWSKVEVEQERQVFNLSERADGTQLPNPGQEFNLGLSSVDPDLVTTQVGLGRGGINIQEWDGSGVEPHYRWIQKLKRSETEYNIFYSTIWDLFDEMTLRHPGFVKHPRIYDKSNRMTMFFGLPDQRYWSREAQIDEAQLSNELYRQMTDRSNEILSDTLASTAFDQTVRRATRRQNRRQRRAASIGRDSHGVSLDTPGHIGNPERAIMDLVVVQANQLRDWLEVLQRRFRPFRDWHHVNSATDIVSNNMIANSYGFYTAIDLQYIGGRSLRQLRKAVRRLDDDNINILSPNAFVRFKDKHIQHVQSQRDLSPENKRAVAMQFPNCRGKVMAKRYARAMLAQFAKEMYKGSLLLLGNSKIKPYDVLVLADTYNDIHGPIEVEEVVHILTPTTGYVTEVIPDTFIIQEDIAPYVIYNGILPTVQMKSDLYLSNMLFTHDDSLGDNHAYNIVARAHRESFEDDAETGFSGLLNRLVYETADNPFGVVGVGVESVVNGEASAGVALGAGAAVTAAVATGTTGAMTAIGAATSILARYFLLNYIANHKAFIMVPLIRGGQPWVSGYDLTTNNTMYRGPFDLMRRWWDDGAAGATLANAEAAAYDRRVREFYGDELNWYSKATLNFDRFVSTARTRLAGGSTI
jgi:hypothetical protein